MTHTLHRSPRWMSHVLIAAAIYNLVWGGWVILWPSSFFDWLDLPRPNYPQLWQCIGMIVGVYGIGYAAAAMDPYRHWPIVLVGLLGKIVGPIGFLQSLITGDLPWRFGWTIITNDLIWWVPFTLILLGAWKHFLQEGDAPPPLRAEDALASARTQDGRTLLDLSQERPMMLVFLRHFG